MGTWRLLTSIALLVSVMLLAAVSVEAAEENYEMSLEKRLRVTLEEAKEQMKSLVKSLEDHAKDQDIGSMPSTAVSGVDYEEFIKQFAKDANEAIEKGPADIHNVLSNAAKKLKKADLNEAPTDKSDKDYKLKLLFSSAYEYISKAQQQLENITGGESSKATSRKRLFLLKNKKKLHSRHVKFGKSKE